MSQSIDDLPTTPGPRRYSPEQLARLIEISTVVECECPNHLAQLVDRLAAFEAYSKDCESKDDKDREIHALLYRVSGHARGLLEEALEVLVAHENIEI